MSKITINHAILHELVKDAGSNETTVEMASTELDAGSDVVVSLVDKIEGLIGSREGSASFGEFKTGPARPQIEGLAL